MLRRHRRALSRMLLAFCPWLPCAPAAYAEVRVTDVQRVMLGFYFEDLLAIARPGALSPLVSAR